jgi:hypothetical protein
LGLYNRPEVAAVPGDVSPTPIIIIIITAVRVKCDRGIFRHSPDETKQPEQVAYGGRGKNSTNET